jgi:hypothetical protein
MARGRSGQLAWYLKRLTAMSTEEIRSRLKSQARHRLDDLEYRVARSRWRLRWEPPTSALSTGCGSQVLGFLTPERARGLTEIQPEAAAHIVAAAEESLAGTARFFGYPELTIRQPVDYSRDPITGRRWPERHGKLIDYRHQTIGDPKLIWELNRCQQLPGLAQAWLLTGDERFAVGAVKTMVSWIAQQTPGRSVAWSNGFEAGLRAISFALCFDALRGSPQMTPAVERQILFSLFQHGHWIVRDPSTHSSANNHVVGELAGLATIALLAPELARAAEWERHAVTSIASQADRQVLSDGLGAEQAFTYTLFVADLLALIVALLEARDRRPPQTMLDALARVGRALWAQLGHQDPAPTYGDTDDAVAMRLDGRDLRDPRGVAATIAACTGDPSARRVTGGLLDPTAWWLFGEPALLAASDPDERPSSVALKEGGLVVLRDSGRRVMMDVGTLGYLSIAAHAHADALQITLSDHRGELVVDPGTGSYFARPVWRSAFRGTAFHPTVTVDGLDQSEQAGPFLWRSHATAWPIHLDLDCGTVVAEHDGYRRLQGGVRHRRGLVVLAQGPIVVYDRLDSTGPHRYRQTWPLHPDLEARIEDGRVLVEYDRAPRLSITTVSPGAPPAIRLMRGNEEPFSGWWSPRLEACVPAWHCAWEKTGAGVTEFATALCTVGSDRWPEAALTLDSTEEGTIIAVSTRDRNWTIAFNFGNEVPVSTSHQIGFAAGGKGRS